MENSTPPYQKSIMIVAAESSSALYAKRLLECYKENKEDYFFFGIGSKSMEDLGFFRIGKSEEMAVVGFKEVLSHYSDIKNVFHNLVKEVEKNKPEFILLLDYPGFNLRLAKALSFLRIPIIYYISPQIWAWKASRIKIIQKYIHKMLVLFPFEKPFYEKFDVPVDFVGHPLLDEISEDKFTKDFQSQMKKKYKLLESDQVLGLMPGSRHSEIEYNLETQVQTAFELKRKNNEVKICMLVADSLELDEVKKRVGPELREQMIWMQEKPVDMIAMADVILCASGTATIFVGLLLKPMVIMYKMNPMTAFFAKMLVKNTPYFGMVNLILEKEVGKEFFQSQATPENMALELEKLMFQPEFKSEKINELKELKKKLGDQGATKRVYNALKEYL